ncbi:MAG: maleate cis-trans isomerase family protein [Oscillospiraceae bacterium]|jgi:maleate isomerase
MVRPFTYGWRGRIGLVATAPGNATEADFNKYRPEGVAVMTTRTPLTSSTPEGIRQMNRFIEDAALMLARNAYCDVILCSSTAGSFVDGREADEARAEKLSRKSGCKVITSAACMLQALNALGIGSVTLITPSSKELNCLEIAFLESAGIKVTAQGGFHLSSPRDILAVSPMEVAELVRQKDCAESDGILLSCSGLHVMEIIGSLEKELGKPVLASNQFGLWGCLRALGISDKLPGLGILWQH